MSREDDLREEWQYQQMQGGPRYPQGQPTGCWWKFIVLLVIGLLVLYFVFLAKGKLPFPT
jgi:hypothetical protein